MSNMRNKVYTRQGSRYFVYEGYNACIISDVRSTLGGGGRQQGSVGAHDKHGGHKDYRGKGELCLWRQALFLLAAEHASSHFCKSLEED